MGYKVSFYFIENKYEPEIQNWGDFGSILWEGFAATSGDGRVLIERAGPYVPDIYETSSTFICTDSAKKKLEGAGIRGVTFELTKKEKIVLFDWKNGDKHK